MTSTESVGTVPLMEPDWRTRLRAALDTTPGLTMRSVSLTAGLGATFVRDALERNRRPYQENALKIEKALRDMGAKDWRVFNPAEAGPLAPEPSPQMTPSTDLNIPSMRQDLPVMGNASCGDDGLFDMNGQILGYVSRPPGLMGVKDAYALWVQGESMSPWREHGAKVVVHPHQPARINDYVVVQLKPTNGHDEHRPAYIKRLVKRTPTTLVLRQFSPPKDIAIPLSKVLSVHRILDWEEAMGF